jgi:hypothetical protein
LNVEERHEGMGIEITYTRINKSDGEGDKYRPTRVVKNGKV